MDAKLLKRIEDFSIDRDWGQFHTGKDLALSLNLEVSELLEIYQWSGTDLECSDKISQIKEELADVFIYAIMLANNYKLDINEIIDKKMDINEKKYPKTLVKGKSLKYTEYNSDK